MGVRERAWLGWGLLAATVVLVGWLARDPVAAQVPELGEEELAQGRQLYDTNCTTCHGSEARGGLVPGTDVEVPALTDVSAAYVDLVVRVGRMPPAADPTDNRPREVLLEPDERRLLVAWMTQTFDLDPAIPEPSGTGDVAEGLQVFSLNCAACHGATGAGGVAGQGAWTPTINDRDAVAILEAIRVGPFEMPRFSTEQISDAQADSVVAFMRTVEEEAGTPLLGLVEMDPVTASAFVVALTVALVVSLLYIGGRATTFPDRQRGQGSHPPEGPPEEDDDR